jgi:hypothetical protein
MEKQASNDKAAQMRLMQAAYGKMANALKATGRPVAALQSRHNYVLTDAICLGLSERISL